ncbi:MAG: hypothetical protein EB167_05330 [Nitrososphaeria archaeon]|nr:hypothetical protein [Nitrososphaeria archaeon]NDB89102.1 hypothetical protein [Nitrososphaerota archaeon]NDF27634.1 hypothetical protein [Nitrosopumilaceae archaeon]NDB90247.1 hypothetical protein [Nitrososphaerota archaeon]NDB92110.1 hypothetical protein [Nitrososphaeria archaeon]
MLGILSLEQIKIVSNFCTSVISENEHVLLVCAINKNGRIIDSAKRNDSILSTLSKHESEIAFMQRILQISMMRDLDDKLGELSFATIHRQNFTECLFPFQDAVILVLFDTADIKDSVAEILVHIQELGEKISIPKIVC